MKSCEFRTIATFSCNVSLVTRFRFDVPTNLCLRYIPSSDASSTANRPPSSSGLGHRPFTAATRVRIPLGVPAGRSCERHNLIGLTYCKAP